MRSKLILLALALATSGDAAILNSPTLLYTDVSNTVRSAVAGDTVQLPSGSIVWSNNEQLIITNRVSILGAGTNFTTINRGTGAASLFWFDKIGAGNSSNLLVQCANMTVVINNGPSSGTIVVGNVTETNRNFRIHHIVFANNGARAIETFGLAEGLVDHCFFWATNAQSGQSITTFGVERAGTANGGNNTGSLNYGTNDNWQIGVFTDRLYVEDCVFGYNNTAAVMDAWSDTYFDGHQVMRYNILTNSNFDAHTEKSASNQIYRCQPVWEFYGNKCYATTPGRSVWFFLRTGYGVVFSNSMTYTGSSPFSQPSILLAEYGASGTNIFRHLRVTAVTVNTTGSGYHAGDLLSASGGEVQSNATFTVSTVDGAGGVTAVTIASPGSYTHGAGTPGPGPPTPNTVTGGTGTGCLLNFTSIEPWYEGEWCTGLNTWDGNKNDFPTNAGYPALDQVGWGDPSVWTATNITQTLHPVYSWSNTFNGTNVGFLVLTFGSTADAQNNVGLNYAVNGWQLPCPTNFLQVNREYYNDTPKPGYTPAAYPHPLQGLGRTYNIGPDYTTLTNHLLSILNTGDTLNIASGTIQLLAPIVLSNGKTFSVHGAGSGISGSNYYALSNGMGFTLQGSGQITTLLPPPGNPGSVISVGKFSDGGKMVWSDLNCVGSDPPIGNVNGFFSFGNTGSGSPPSPGAGNGVYHVYNCQFTNTYVRCISAGFGTVHGLIDHCLLIGWPGGTGSGCTFITSWGNSWRTWTNVTDILNGLLGSTNMMVFENNALLNYSGISTAGFTEGYEGGRYCWRYNYVYGCGEMEVHGYDSGNTGHQLMEIYGNVYDNFTNNAPILTFRSGTAYWFSNTIVASGPAGNALRPEIKYYRACQGQPAFVKGYAGYDLTNWFVTNPAAPNSYIATNNMAAVGQQFSYLSNAAILTTWGEQPNYVIDAALNNSFNRHIKLGSSIEEMMTNMVSAINFDLTGAGSIWSSATTNNSWDFGQNPDFWIPQVDYVNHFMILRNRTDGTNQYTWPATMEQGIIGLGHKFTNDWILRSPCFSWSNVAYLNGVLQPSVNVFSRAFQGSSTANGVANLVTNLLIEGRDYFSDTPATNYTPLVFPHPMVADEGPAPPTPDPFIIQNPQNQSVNVGQNATFTVVAGGTTPFNYQWKQGGNTLAGATQSSYTVVNAQLSQNGFQYTCIVGNSKGTQVTAAATLTITGSPQFTLQPQDQFICTGDSATFMVAVTGTQPIRLQWFNGDVPQTGKTNTSYTIFNNQVSTTVFCTASNVVSTATSSTAALVVQGCGLGSSTGISIGPGVTIGDGVQVGP